MPGKPAKPPKPSMRWGVYNKRGVLMRTAPNRGLAKFYSDPIGGDYVARVMVTPIASKGER